MWIQKRFFSDGGPKILHVITESWLPGGAQRNTLITIQGLKRKGYNGENAYRRVFPEFSADLMVDRIENLYLRLLAEKVPEKLNKTVQ